MQHLYICLAQIALMSAVCDQSHCNPRFKRARSIMSLEFVAGFRFGSRSRPRRSKTYPFGACMKILHTRPGRKLAVARLHFLLVRTPSNDRIVFSMRCPYSNQTLHLEFSPRISNRQQHNYSEWSGQHRVWSRGD